MRQNIFILIIVFVFISPQLIFQQFSLLDTIETLSVGTFQLFRNVFELVSFPFHEHTRFRPVFIWERIILNSLLHNVREYFLFMAFLLGSTLLVAKSIIGKSKLLTFQSLLLFLVLFLFSPITVDAYWRLGTAENLFIFFLLISLYCLQSGKYFLMSICNILLVLSKETAIFYIPIFAIGTFIKEKYLYTIIHLILIIVILPILSSKVHIASSEEVYTSLFTINILKNIEIGILYVKTFPQVTIIFILNIYLFTKLFVKKQVLHLNSEPVYMNIIFLLNVIFTVLTLVIFNNIQAYYLLPMHFLLITWFLYQYNRLEDITFKRFLTIAILIIFVTNFSGVKEQMQYWQNDYAADQPLLEYLETSQSTYYVHPDNRIDHRGAFKYLLGNRYISDISQADYVIMRNYHMVLSKEDMLFCSYNFFQERICKWYIIK